MTQWIRLSPGHYETACGLGRITGGGDYYLIHWRAVAGQGQWTPVPTPTGRRAIRRSLDTAKIAVEDHLRARDRKRAERVIEGLKRFAREAA